MQIVLQNPIRGTVALDINGRNRKLDLDLTAIAVLYDRHGDDWTEWLHARFSGRPKMVAGVQAREFAKITPADLSLLLFAGLASDREEQGIVETEIDLRKSIGLSNMGEIQKALTRMVLASMGIEGEVVEVLESALRGPRNVRRQRA